MSKSVHSPLYERLRQLLIERRQQAGLTQAQLAKRLSKPQSYISKYEKGERRLDVVELIEVAEAAGFDFQAFTVELTEDSGR